jgi:hypothetical protein
LMLEAGVTTMYPYEIGAGNDALRARKRYPTVGIVGGLNKNAMALGQVAMEVELERARQLIKGGRAIPGPDHFVLSNVSWENYKYFMGRLREVVLTTRPGE